MSSAVAEEVLAMLADTGQTLATAESLTGGLLGALLTDVPGASRSYLGGMITYATRLKSELAGVDPRTLHQWGPVASATAVEMAVGVSRRCGADWGVGITGVAGPEAQDAHPVGQVFAAVAQREDPAEVTVQELALHGSREQIRRQAAEAALHLLAMQLRAQP